ncbi:MAG: hypothetical protein Q7J86_06875 [Bacteroidota bacterium]|nr:hypothetical protein [Bacteroidota bacterium]
MESNIGTLPQTAKALAGVRRTFRKMRKPQPGTGEPSAKCGSSKTIKVDKSEVK